MSPCSPFMSLSKSAGTVESPHIMRLSPKDHTSPFLISTSVISSFLSSFWRSKTSGDASSPKMRSSSSELKPTSARKPSSKPPSMSQSNSPVVRLLRILYSSNSSSVSLRLGTRTSISSLPRPRARRIFTRWCPAISRLSASIAGISTRSNFSKERLSCSACSSVSRLGFPVQGRRASTRRFSVRHRSRSAIRKTVMMI